MEEFTWRYELGMKKVCEELLDLGCDVTCRFGVSLLVEVGV